MIAAALQIVIVKAEAPISRRTMSAAARSVKFAFAGEHASYSVRPQEFAIL